MRALVTGGNGFIGSHLVDRLLEGGWSVTVVDLKPRPYDDLPCGVRFLQGDLSQPGVLEDGLRGADIVFHLAWGTIHETSNADPVADVLGNLVPTMRLFQACANRKAGRVVFLSSGGTVYGLAQHLPIPEDHPTAPLSAYGVSKLAGEKYLSMLGRLCGLEYAILRPSAPYGERQNPLGRQGAVAVFLYRALHQLPITIWGDGDITRDYFHVSDLTQAIVSAAVARLEGARTFNVGGGRGISLSQLVRAIEDLLGRQVDVTYGAPRRFDPPRLVLDIRRARVSLGWEPCVPLQEGLRRTIGWMTSAVPAPGVVTTHGHAPPRPLGQAACLDAGDD